MTTVMQCNLEGMFLKYVAPKLSRHRKPVCPVGSMHQQQSKIPRTSRSQLPLAVPVVASLPADEETFAFDVLVSDDPEVLAEAIARLQRDNERMREELQAAVKALESVSPAASVLWAKQAAFHLEGLTADDLAQGYPDEVLGHPFAEPEVLRAPEMVVANPAIERSMPDIGLLSNGTLEVGFEQTIHTTDHSTRATAAAYQAVEAVDLPASDKALLQELEEAKARLAERPSAQVEQAEQTLDMVFVTAEVAPWSKTGGLGDVMGSLPIALAKRGHRVMVVAPRYLDGKSDELYEAAKDTGVRLSLPLGACGEQTVGFFHLHRDDVDWVFVDHPSYHRAGNPYGDQNGVFGDNQFRYALLSMAACEAPLQLPIGGYRSGEPPGFPYGEACMFIANDWHASLVPAYLAGKYRRGGVYRDARCALIIHNLSHQGVEPAATFSYLGLPDDWYDPLSWAYPEWAAINGGQPAVNILKGGILASDCILTVSSGYAWEITTPEGGWGLHHILSGRGHLLSGITNGIDMDEWNPALDPYLPVHFTPDDTSGKAECKAALQRELGFAVDPNIPLLGWIGRLDHQKGPDLVLDAIPHLAGRGCQVVMLGSGNAEYEDGMRAAEAHHRSNFRGWVGFSIPVAHRILAGCDILLMPSRFEPCGLNQLFAMRYGTIPIAHATGGLRDTIQTYSEYQDGMPSFASACYRNIKSSEVNAWLIQISFKQGIVKLVGIVP
eukprot:jgi/Botrbrau1/16731/Bobra.0301s0003.2